MPHADEPAQPMSLAGIAALVGLYPVEAFEFIHQGLNFTVTRLHGDVTDAEPGADRHVSGKQLCEGLRDFARDQWGLLAGVVLRRWNINDTLDFGRIVFALVEHGQLRKTDSDSIEDFRHVYDFASAFDQDYRIESKS